MIYFMVQNWARFLGCCFAMCATLKCGNSDLRPRPTTERGSAGGTEAATGGASSESSSGGSTIANGAGGAPVVASGGNQSSNGVGGLPTGGGAGTGAIVDAAPTANDSCGPPNQLLGRDWAFEAGTARILPMGCVEVSTPTGFQTSYPWMCCPPVSRCDTDAGYANWTFLYGAPLPWCCSYAGFASGLTAACCKDWYLNDGACAPEAGSR